MYFGRGRPGIRHGRFRGRFILAARARQVLGSRRDGACRFLSGQLGGGLVEDGVAGVPIERAEDEQNRGGPQERARHAVAQEDLPDAAPGSGGLGC